MRKRAGIRPLRAVKLLPDMSKEIFQQGGVPAHTASKTQQWRRADFFDIWQKVI